ncbi:methyltransferase regulatory domain-containing protein [Dickeya zeae]|nr:methyltransferase regulatory domain-containing protein [Dickeya zeae]
MPDTQPLANNTDLDEDTGKAPLSSMSPPIPHTAPFHLQATAHLYGIKSAAPEKARVLEIGCKDGGNLLPFALANPQAQAVGVDLDAEQIEKGIRLIKRLELENVALFALDLESLLACDPGTFDYIIIHGLFSLIGGETRDALLRFCHDHLTAEGLVCYCYNTYPGWKTGEILRDAIQLHSGLASDEKVVNASARAMLTYMSLGTAPDNPQNAALKSFIDQAEKQSDVDFALHYLQGLNQPCYFVDFYSQITQAGFSYVGDVRAYTELAEHYGEQVSHLHETICPENTVYLRQQYLDFAVNRSQRFSILIPEERAKDILPSPDLAKLEDFNWAGNFQRINVGGGKTLNAHTSGTGETISTENAVVLGILDTLGEAWPASLSLEQLVFNTRLPEKQAADHRQDVLDALKNLFIKGICGVYVCLGKCTYRKSQHKMLTGLPGIATTDLSFNFWHEPVELSDDERQLLRQLPSRDLVKDEEFYRNLWSLRNKGVIWGTPRAWRDYLQEAMVAADARQVAVYVRSLVAYTSNTDVGGFVEPQKSVVHKRHKLQDKNPLSRKVYEEIDRLTAQGNFTEAREKAEAIIHNYPDNLSVWYPFVHTFVRTSDFDGALRVITRAIALMPLNWDFYVDLAVCFWKKNELHAGMALVRKVLRCDKSKGLAWDTLAVLLNITHDLDSAFTCMEKALQLEPKNPSFISHMGMVCHNLGRKDANDYHRKTIELMPNAFFLHSNLLLGLSHDVNVTPQALFQEHLMFGQRVEEAAAHHHCQFICSINKDANRPLRIGFISGDFGDHPVTNFLEPIWNSLDRDAFSLYAYSNFQRNDTKANSLKQTAAGWYDVDKMGDLELATLINKDEIDILIDLSGHTAYNRLPVFALKPAPIQITWLGYPGTTGMRAMDYILMDRNFLERGALDDQLTESAIYMPSVKFFEPHNDCPDVNELPALKNGYLTFASFNRPQKITDETLALWAKVLTALPDSRLVMGYMTGQECIDYFRSKLIDFGVLESQLSFRMRTGLKEYLGMHQEVDMLLDAYPYSGGTTVGHAAWMGVPVLTLEGVTMASRQGGVIMRIYGLSDFVAGNDDEFMSKALYWSKSFKELSVIRSGLRERMSNKNKVDVSPSFYFEKALHQVWENYCEGNRPRSFRIEPDGVIL